MKICNRHLGHVRPVALYEIVALGVWRSAGDKRSGWQGREHIGLPCYFKPRVHNGREVVLFAEGFNPPHTDHVRYSLLLQMDFFLIIQA
jgi:hypothetical protein